VYANSGIATASRSPFGLLYPLLGSPRAARGGESSWRVEEAQLRTVRLPLHFPTGPALNCQLQAIGVSQIGAPSLNPFVCLPRN